MIKILNKIDYFLLFLRMHKMNNLEAHYFSTPYESMGMDTQSNSVHQYFLLCYGNSQLDLDSFMSNTSIGLSVKEDAKCQIYTELTLMYNQNPIALQQLMEIRDFISANNTFRIRHILDLFEQIQEAFRISENSEQQGRSY